MSSAEIDVTGTADAPDMGTPQAWALRENYIAVPVRMQCSAVNSSGKSSATPGSTSRLGMPVDNLTDWRELILQQSQAHEVERAAPVPSAAGRVSRSEKETGPT